jgi:signal transduction histidine kinase
MATVTRRAGLSALRDGGAVGLRSLEQRVDDLGGSALVESVPGAVARIAVRVPLPSVADPIAEA